MLVGQFMIAISEAMTARGAAGSSDIQAEGNLTAAVDELPFTSNGLGVYSGAGDGNRTRA